MSFVVEHKVWLRIFALALFILSMLGPWTFDLVNVPAFDIIHLPNEQGSI